MTNSAEGHGLSARDVVLPLALCQFVASYAGTNINVAISSIAQQLGTSVTGVQTSITLFTLTMAALIIPGSKLTDVVGRKFCFMLGLVIYGAGAVIAALAVGLPVLIIGYSIFEGVGSALMIPPIYIIITVAFRDLTGRARSFGIVSAAAGVGAAGGPLIGGLITSGISWRASFIAQALLVVVIIVAGSRLAPDRITGSGPGFDAVGAVLSALGLFLVVLGFLQSRTYGWFAARTDFKIAGTVVIAKGGVSPVWLFVGAGALVLVGFFLSIRARERAGKEPLLSTRLFKNKTSNLGLITQIVQWLVLQGAFFVISVFLQQVRHFNAIQTGLTLTPATVGVLGSLMLAGRLAKRVSQKVVIWAGLLFTMAGIALLLAFGRASSNVATFVPDLLLIGIGIGGMLTSSVNVVQGSFPDCQQGEISGLSRSASNLGSSLGTAVAGSVLVSTLVEGNKHFALALATMEVIALIGLVAALLLPRNASKSAAP